MGSNSYLERQIKTVCSISGYYRVKRLYSIVLSYLCHTVINYFFLFAVPNKNCTFGYANGVNKVLIS